MDLQGQMSSCAGQLVRADQNAVKLIIYGIGDVYKRQPQAESFASETLFYMSPCPFLTGTD